MQPATLTAATALRLALMLALGAAGGNPASAAEPPASSAGPTLLTAVAQSPAVAAARQRVEAARIRVESSGRLPDPEVEAMGMRTSDSGPNANTWELNLRQPLPRRGERAADRERAEAMVQETEADYAMLAGELAAETAAALAEHDGAIERIHLLEAQTRRLESVLQSVDARLGGGAGGRISERLTVQTRIAALQLAVEQERRAAADADAEVRGRLGLAPGAPLPVFEALGAAEIDVTTAPALQLASARTANAQAMSKMARASANPMTGVGLRLERSRSGMGNEDMIGLAFSAEIPWRSRRYARTEVRAADADRAAAHAEGEAARHQIASAISRAERADRLAAVARQLGTESRTRFDAEVDALSRTAGLPGEGSSVLEAVEILEKSTDIELQIIEAEITARRLRAGLWRYAPAGRLIAGPSTASPHFQTNRQSQRSLP